MGSELRSKQALRALPADATPRPAIRQKAEDTGGMSLAQTEVLLPVSEGERSTGLLPSQLLRAAVGYGRNTAAASEIIAAAPIDDDQIQPASLDLRLGEVAYRVRASFLPGARSTVQDKLDLLSMHRIDLSG